MSSVPTQNATNQVGANQSSKTNHYDKFNRNSNKQGDAFASMLSGLKQNMFKGVGHAERRYGNDNRFTSSGDQFAQEVFDQRQDAIEEQREREEEQEKKRIAQERRERELERQEDLKDAQEDASKMAVNLAASSQESPFARLMSSLASSGTAVSTSGTKSASGSAILSGSGSAVASGSDASGSGSSVASGSGFGSGSGSSMGLGSGSGSAVASGSGSNVNGYAVADADDAAAKAAALMSEVSDDSIEADLNEINLKNLSAAPETPEQDATERLQNLNNSDLRKNLDNLARASSVTKLSIQMDNPKTQAQDRSNAAAIANLPTSNNKLAAFSGTASPASGPNAGPSGTTSNAQPHVSTETMIKFRQSQQQLNGTTSEEVASTKTQSSKTLLEITSGTKSMNADELAKLVTQKQQHGAILENDHAGAKAIQASANMGTSVSTVEQALASLKQGLGQQQQNLSHGFNPQNFVKSDGLSVEALTAQTSQDSAFSNMGGQSQGFSGEQAAAFAPQSGFGMSQTQGTSQSAPAGSAQSSMFLSSNAAENANELHEKVMQMAARNLKQLSVDLSPNNLGRMRIEIALDRANDALSVSLAAAYPQTREALEQALPKLRDALSQQNILADETVHDLADVIADSDMAEHGQGESNSNAGHNAQTAQEFLAQRSAAKLPVSADSQDNGIEFAKSQSNEVVADNLTDAKASSKLAEATVNSAKSELNIFA